MTVAPFKSFLIPFDFISLHISKKLSLRSSSSLCPLKIPWIFHSTIRSLFIIIVRKEWEMKRKIKTWMRACLTLTSHSNESFCCIQSHLFRERMMLKCERSQLKMNGFEKNEECQLVTGLFQAENILNFWRKISRIYDKNIFLKMFFCNLKELFP